MMTLKFLTILAIGFSLSTAPLIGPASAEIRKAPEAGGDVVMTRSFVDGPFGQIHIRTARPAGEPTRPPLILLHPTPYSGSYYAAYMPLMAADRIVIAFDTPGYGDSAAPDELQPISAYAEAIAGALDTLGYGAAGDGPVDMLGYHTGTLIATEIAIARPDLARRLVLPGLAYFAEETRQKYYDDYAKPDPVLVDGSHIDAKWEFASRHIKNGLSIDAAQAFFNDAMQCYPDCWRAYHGVFTYEAEARFPKVTQPTLLVSINGSLREETEDAARYFKNARHIYLNDVKDSGFTIVPEKLAAATRNFLDQE